MKTTYPIYKLTARSIHLEWLLLTLIFVLMAYGTLILFSASNQNMTMFLRQITRILFALAIMVMFSQIPPHKYKIWSPWLYGWGLILLLAVMVMGKIGKGAQRWLDLGFFRFQPSEIMKLAVPLMTAWYLDRKKLPIDFKTVLGALTIILVPTLFIAKQPDLGTAIMVVIAGFSTIFLAGISFRIMISGLVIIVAGAPLLWHIMHAYQKKRILMLLNPEQDPLGAGYHIIQSKIAIGSGGSWGKGWLAGTQSHLNFLPEHTTDFIFAVSGEEFGLIGCLFLLILYILIALRGLYIAAQAQTNFSRLLAASLTMTFFLSAFVNMGMVMGILPVVGIPLPLVSYGGTALLTFLASFGILMSIATHRILFKTLP